MSRRWIPTLQDDPRVEKLMAPADDTIEVPLLFERESPPWVLSETLSLLQCYSDEDWVSADLYFALIDVADSDLAARRAYRVIRLVSEGHSLRVPPMKTRADAEALVEKALHAALLIQAGALLYPPTTA